MTKNFVENGNLSFCNEKCKANYMHFIIKMLSNRFKYQIAVHHHSETVARVTVSTLIQPVCFSLFLS